MDPKSEIPSMEVLLVSMDTADRDEVVQLANTVHALVQRAELDGVNPDEYLKLCLLVAFKRRNHLKSQAPGNGAGEKLFLRTVLCCVAAISPDLVQRVVPLVPEYGSWRDLRLLGDEMFKMASDDSASVKGNELAVAKSVAQAFASQLTRDLAAARLRAPGVDTPSVGGAGAGEQDIDAVLTTHVSNASKYAPSCSRHRGSKRSREGRDEPIVAGDHRRVHRRGGLPAGWKALSAKELAKAVVLRKRNHEAEEQMTDEVARCLGLRPTHLRADLRKLVVSPLNAILASQGHTIERLLCERRHAEVDFRAVCKGSLTKYAKAIKKDPEAWRRWRLLAKVSAAAVPDLDDLSSFAEVFRASQHDEDERDLCLRSVTKAVNSAVAERDRLEKRADAIIAEAAVTGTSGENGGDGGGAHSAIAQAVALVVVDLASAASRSEATALVAAAFISARSQERRGCPRQSILVNGSRGAVLVDIPFAAVEAEKAKLAADEGALALEATTTKPGKPVKKERNCSTADGRDFEALLALLEVHLEGLTRGESGSPLDVASLERGAAVLLEAHGQAAAADVVVLCASFGAGRDPTLADAIARLQAGPVAGPVAGTPDEATMGVVAIAVAAVGLAALGPTVATLAAGLPDKPVRTRLRALLVHRCRHELIRGTVMPFVPRRNLRGPTPPLADCVVDLCIVMDCTGSMGSWMDACKLHLKSILLGLGAETGVREFRVAFVGYRDYGDAGRVVVAPFVTLADVAAVEAVINAQQPSGGDDEPEDVCAAMAAVSGLAWAGDLRITLHVADATAHGYCSSRHCFDNHPKGTPDQVVPLAEVMARLRDPLATGADLLFCRLTDRTVDLEYMYSSTYKGGEGFGILPMLSGAGAFKDAVLGTLAASLLGRVAVETSAVQTFDGRTLSAVLATLNAGFKESIREAGGVSEGPKATEFSSGATSAVALRTDSKGVAKVASARGDSARLMAELEGDDLLAVRIALKMPAAGPATGSAGLAASSARALLSLGISAEELVAQGYPETIVDMLRKATLEQLRRVA